MVLGSGWCEVQDGVRYRMLLMWMLQTGKSTEKLLRQRMGVIYLWPALSLAQAAAFTSAV